MHLVVYFYSCVVALTVYKTETDRADYVGNG
jgi:hypothetical protein